MAQVPCKLVYDGYSINYTPVSAVTMGDVVVLQSKLVCISPRDIAAGALGSLDVGGTWSMPKVSGSISQGVALYWDADADPASGDAGSGAVTTNSALGPFAGWAAEASSGSTIKVILKSQEDSTTVLRSSLGQNDLAPYGIGLRQLYVWDAPASNPVTAGANDDLALIYNTFGSASPSVETGDVKAAGAVTRRIGFQFVVPVEYVAGETATVRLRGGMKTTVADTSATIDLEVYRAAAPTVDICTTSAQSINSLTAANKDFSLTTTSLVPGDVLDCRVTIATNDAATGTAVIGKWYISESAFLLDIKG